MYPLLVKPRKIVILPESAGLHVNIKEKTILSQINHTASDILSLCNGENTTEYIIKQLSQKYNEKLDIVKELVTDFISTSIDYGTIEILNHAKKHEIKIVGSKDYWLPSVISVELTYKCPLFCKHCYRDAKINRTECMSLDGVKKIAREMKELGILYVQLTGGEPLIHPNINEIIKEFIDNEIMVTLITSGYYKDESIFSTLEQYSSKFGNIQVSIDGMSNTHNKIRRRDDSFERAIEFIKKSNYLGIPIDVASTIIDQKKEEIKELSIYLKSLGVKRHRLGVIMKAGRSIDNIITGYNKIDVVKSWSMNINKEIQDDNFMVQLNENNINASNQTCGAGFKTIRISPMLEIHPCPMIKLPLINLKQSSILDYCKQYSINFKNIQSPNKDICKECNFTDNCKGCLAEGLINKVNVNKCYWSDNEGKFLTSMFQV